jgi:HAD superfamily hydrolase (TIGR01549 family)
MQNGDFFWDAVLPEAMINRKEEIIASARPIIDDISPRMFRQDVRIIPGADEMLKTLSSAGLKLGLVTSTVRKYMPLKMKVLVKAGVDKLLESVITIDDVENKKPAAEPLIACGKKLGVALDKSVYVGDTRVDIRAGRNAGMKTLGVLTGFDSYAQLRQEKPDAILNSVCDLRARIALGGK